MFLKEGTILCAVLLSLFPLPAFSQSAPSFRDVDCQNCHGRATICQIQSDGRLRSLFVDPIDWSRDIHQKSGMSCVDCHTNANPAVHFREGYPDVDCARCHPEEEEEYTKNIHFEYKYLALNRVLPQCYDCHTKHGVLLHDDSESSVSENNIGETCSRCHPEVMIKGILKGSSLGKISGHRKGDLSEKFDMNVCISCHYSDSAHGRKRTYKDFCSRCHDPADKGNAFLGGTHVRSFRWTGSNLLGSALSLLLIAGLGCAFGYNFRKNIVRGVRAWHERMKSQPTEEDKACSRGDSSADDTGAPAERTSGKTEETE